MLVLEGPTSEVGLEPPHRVGHVVASSCKVVMGGCGNCGCLVCCCYGNTLRSGFVFLFFLLC